jgi:hypothetical protein
VINAAASTASRPGGILGRRDVPACTHLDQVRILESPEHVAGCAECLKTGSSWVHLRMCQTCGEIGWCDSSPNRHASRHAQEQNHPVLRSAVRSLRCLRSCRQLKRASFRAASGRRGRGQGALPACRRQRHRLAYRGRQRARGGGSRRLLVRETLERIRASGKSVIPTCPFTAAYIRRHPEFVDLVEETSGTSRWQRPRQGTGLRNPGTERR